MTEEIGLAHALEEIKARREDQRNFHNHKENVIYLATGGLIAVAAVFFKPDAELDFGVVPNDVAVLISCVIAHLFIRWQQKQRERSAVLIDLYDKTTAALLFAGYLDQAPPRGPDKSTPSPWKRTTAACKAACAALLPLSQVGKESFRGPNLPGFMVPIIDTHFSERPARCLFAELWSETPSVFSLMLVVLATMKLMC